MPKKLTYEYVKKYFEERECKLISTEYINANMKLNYQCKSEHISEITYASFKAGHGCAKCYGNDRLTFENVKIYFEEQKCELLETEYINTHTDMKYRCKCGNISNIVFSRFKDGGDVLNVVIMKN